MPRKDIGGTMEKTKSFEELIVWQKAHQFVLDVYALTQSFPRDEQFGLTSQFRRAAISIAANIAEGYSKKGYRDKLKFFNISQGSLSECRYYLRLAHDLHYAETTELSYTLVEVSKLLSTYMRGILRNNYS